MSDLRLVNWNDHSQDPDSDACDKTTDVKHCDHDAGSLNDAADHEDTTCREYGAPAAQTV